MFDKYNSVQMYAIAQNILKKKEFKLSPEAAAQLNTHFRNKKHGNGREVRNLIEAIIRAQANNLIDERSKLSRSVLETIDD